MIHHPPDFQLLLDEQTAVNLQIANTPAGHPSLVVLQTRKAAIAQDIVNHPKRTS